MTLIAFATNGDSAEFITDTANYTDTVTKMGHGTKHITLNHLDAAVLTQGRLRFGDGVKSGALQASRQVATFDALVESAPEWIREIWTGMLSDGVPPAPSVAFFLGWSDSRQRFTAHAVASDHDFEPFEVEDFWVMPTPWTMRPSDLELTRLQEYMRECGDTEDDVADCTAKWTSKSPGLAPTTYGEWVDLAAAVREQRALESFGRVIVAGKVLHTRLERGAVETEVIHAFEDAGDEFLQLVAFTQHPQGQVLPCWCGSGLRFLDCHLAPELDQPCGCTSGRLFRDCCMVGAPRLARKEAALT